MDEAMSHSEAEKMAAQEWASLSDVEKRSHRDEYTKFGLSYKDLGAKSRTADLLEESDDESVGNYKDEFFHTNETLVVNYIKISKTILSIESTQSYNVLLPLSMRNYDRSMIPPEIVNNVENTYSVLKKLSKLLQDSVSSEVYEQLTTKYKTARDIFERSTPTTQCNNTVGKLGTNTKCWICDIAIGKTGEFKFDNSPECEHIFPTAQAICFTGLYDSVLERKLRDEVDDRGVARSEAYTNELIQTEYKWSHRLCNQIKKDTHFIILDKNQKFSIGLNYVKELLHKILKTTKYGGGNNLWQAITRVNPSVKIEDWVNNRAANINAICANVINRANSLNLSPKQFEECSKMAIREYIATDPDISNNYKMITKIVNSVAPAKTLSISPGVLTKLESSEILNITTPLTNYIIDDFLNGAISRVIDNLGKRTLKTDHIARVNLFTYLSGKDKNILAINEVNRYLEYFKQIRTAIFCLSFNKNKGDERKVWSDVQTLLPIVIYSKIMGILTVFYKNLVGKSGYIREESNLNIIASQISQLSYIKTKLVEDMLQYKLGVTLFQILDIKFITETFVSFDKSHPSFTIPGWFGARRKPSRRGKRNHKTKRNKRY